MEADGLAEAADHHDVVVAGGVAHRQQLVAVADVDGDDAVALARRVVAAEQGLLHHAVRGGEDEVLAVADVEVARVDDGADLLVLAQRQQVDDVLALGVAAGQRQLVHLEAVDLADAREEQQVVVRAGDEEVLDLVFFLEIHAGHADAAALLLAVGGDRDALHVAGLGDGDGHLLFGDEVFEVDLALVRHDLGAAVVVVQALDLEQLALMTP